MKRFYKKRLLYVLGGLFVLIAINLFITFSYFEAEIFGNESESTINLDIGYMTIRYDNFSGTIVANGIYPGWTTTKTFSVTGTIPEQMLSEKYSEAYYAVKLVLDKNGLLDDSMVYTLTIDEESDTAGVPILVGTKTGIPSKTSANQVVLGYGSLPKGETVHKYNLNLEYLYRDDVDQTNEMGAEFAAHVVIEGVDQSGLVNIELNLDGGVYPEGIATNYVYTKNSVIELIEPTKDGYVFTGWTASGATVSGNQLTIGTTDATITATYREANYFETDSWATIAANVANGTALTRYQVGATREISLKEYTNTETDSDGKYTIRVANNSNYDCTLDSKTACGFVVEFQDIITAHRMNATDTNKGGWPATEMRDYLNGTFEGSEATQNSSAIINALPSDLRAVIIDTEVISGHGKSDSNSSRVDGNWTSTDKLYLLSTTELFGDCIGATNDTAVCLDYAAQATITRQLDYYASKGVVTSDGSKYIEAIKQLNGRNYTWWLRLARSTSTSYFSIVSGSGSTANGYPASTYGVAPAFRIG